MSSIPSPGPIHIIVHTAPAEWWEIVAAIGPWIILLGALIVFCITEIAHQRKMDKIRREFDTWANGSHL